MLRRRLEQRHLALGQRQRQRNPRRTAAGADASTIGPSNALHRHERARGQSWMSTRRASPRSTAPSALASRRASASQRSITRGRTTTKRFGSVPSLRVINAGGTPAAHVDDLALDRGHRIELTRDRRRGDRPPRCGSPAPRALPRAAARDSRRRRRPPPCARRRGRARRPRSRGTGSRRSSVRASADQRARGRRRRTVAVTVSSVSRDLRAAHWTPIASTIRPTHVAHLAWPARRSSTGARPAQARRLRCGVDRRDHSCRREANAEQPALALGDDLEA